MADVFGVSRIPVRESLKTLVGESLVDHRHQFGYTVAQLTPAELHEMYIVRETLESAALAVAVEQATEEDHEHAVEVNSRLEIAAARRLSVLSLREPQLSPRTDPTVADASTSAHVRSCLEHHRTGSADGPCCRRRPAGTALRSHSDAGRIPASGRDRAPGLHPKSIIADSIP